MPNGLPVRRGINVSAYLQDLNTLPSPEDQIDSFNPDDLDLWTNTQFFDFDMGTHQVASESPREHKPTVLSAPTTATVEPSTLKAGEFDNFLDELKDFDNFDYVPSFDFQEPVAPPTPPTHLPIAAAPLIAPAATISGYTVSSPTSDTPVRNSKRKASVSVSAESPDPSQYGDLEGASRYAAEEDKRRRNTAASARFRVKKKQKEQMLEKTAKDMTDRVSQLEARVQQLELENKWLKGLIVEKNGGKSGEEMLMPSSILTGSKDGVGTIGEIDVASLMAE